MKNLNFFFCVFLSGVWAARADYLPHHLEPREVESFLSPRQQPGEFPSPSRDSIPLGEISRLTAEEEEGEGEFLETASTMTEKDKTELERGIREALFRGGETPGSGRRPYKGRPLRGAWATAGQTGASVVTKTGEPMPGGNLTPVKFSISSPGSSSGHVTPQRSGSRTPNSRYEQTPPQRSRGSNWSTLSPQRGHGNRGAYRHSESGPERSYEAADHRQQFVPRRSYSEQYSWGTGQSDHPNESHDDTHQSEINNWNVHIPRSRRGNSEMRGRGRGERNNQASRREGGDGRARGRGRGEIQSRRGGGEGRGRDQYQRSQSDMTGRRRHTRGAPGGRHRNPPYTEPAVKEQPYK